MAFESNASRRTYEFQELFLEDTEIFWVVYILVQLVLFNNYGREKRVSKKVMLYFEQRRTISISCIEQILSFVEMKLYILDHILCHHNQDEV